MTLSPLITSTVKYSDTNVAFFFLLHILLSLSYSHDSCSPSSQVPPFFQFFYPVLLLLFYDLDVFSAYLILLIKSYLNDQSILSSISLLDSYVVGNFQSPEVNWVASLYAIPGLTASWVHRGYHCWYAMFTSGNLCHHVPSYHHYPPNSLKSFSLDKIHINNF